MRMSEKTTRVEDHHEDHLNVRRPENRGQEYNAPCFNYQADTLWHAKIRKLPTSAPLTLLTSIPLSLSRGPLSTVIRPLAKPYKPLLYTQQESAPPIIQTQKIGTSALLRRFPRQERRTSHMTMSQINLHTSPLMHAVVRDMRLLCLQRLIDAPMERSHARNQRCLLLAPNAPPNRRQIGADSPRISRLISFQPFRSSYTTQLPPPSPLQDKGEACPSRVAGTPF
jgi:hypothetical protein